MTKAKKATKKTAKKTAKKTTKKTASKQRPSEKAMTAELADKIKRLLLALATEPMAKGLEMTGQLELPDLAKRCGMDARACGRILARLISNDNPKVERGSEGHYYLTAAGKKLAKKLIKTSSVTARTSRVPAGPTQAAPGKRTPKPATKDSKKAKKPAEAKRGGLTCAAEYLEALKKPMKAKPLAEAILANGSWKSDGKTPHATLYAAIIREIAKKGDDSRFRRAGKGEFVHKKYAAKFPTE